MSVFIGEFLWNIWNVLTVFGLRKHDVVKISWTSILGVKILVGHFIAECFCICALLQRTLEEYIQQYCLYTFQLCLLYTRASLDGKVF